MANHRAPARWKSLLALLLLLVVPQLHSAAQHSWASPSAAQASAPSAVPAIQGTPVLAQAANDLSARDADTLCELCSTLQGAHLSSAQHLSPVLNDARRQFGPRKHLYTLSSTPLDLFCRPPPGTAQQQRAGVLRPAKGNLLS